MPAINNGTTPSPGGGKFSLSYSNGKFKLLAEFYLEQWYVLPVIGSSIAIGSSILVAFSLWQADLGYKSVPNGRPITEQTDRH